MNTPVQKLYWAALLRSYLDLAGCMGAFHDNERDVAQHQARCFFFDKYGGWATSRRTFSHILDLPEDKIIAVAQQIDQQGLSVGKRWEKLRNG